MEYLKRTALTSFGYESGSGYVQIFLLAFGLCVYLPDFFSLNLGVSFAPHLLFNPI